MKKVYSVYLLIFIAILFTPNLQAEESIGAGTADYRFTNEEMLVKLFDKISELETSKQGKINIVHIGDSHLQAGYFSGAIRDEFQRLYGNGGFGFTFPYELVRTNGPRAIKYVSNTAWSSWQNTRSFNNNVQVGIGGFGLATASPDFVLQLSSEDVTFNKVKIIYPTREAQFNFSASAEPLKITSVVSAGGKTHKVKSGESLSVIARKYGVSIAKIKTANNMKNNNIFAGKTLKIPSNNVTKIANVKLDANVELSQIESHPYYSEYASEEPLRRMTFFPKKGHSKYTINGLVLENNDAGVVYHSIGVNGAHVGDYFKYSLFFDQLSILQPDLIIVSLGTNESFGRMTTTEYMRQMDTFVERLQHQNKNAVVIVTTPPPSLFRRLRVNTFVGEYAKALTSQDKYPVWDLYTHMDGIAGIQKGRFAHMIARDKVHYDQRGYEVQGHMFASDFINTYNNYREQITK